MDFLLLPPNLSLHASVISHDAKHSNDVYVWFQLFYKEI